ncbi:MAG TPA: ShlB/FhaC/HecB family hemolysin secretion/activation protein [Falsiroseomonas sp.]|jgi:hemolysin activation/secretion protein|nr:ShlB/FhaC/HecB family hemolysin secretion/activation protein [Falsiroseomonas sp.]
MRLHPSLVVLLALPGLAFAQVAPPPLTPGRVQQLSPAEAPRLAPALRPATPEAVRGPGELARVRVVAVRLSGNAALADAELLPVLQPLVGQEVPLAAIEDARIRLISAYGRAGYPFVTASAGLAPEGEGAVLTMSVVEGHIASVKLDGDIGPAGTQVLRFLEPLVGNGAITTARLERALLLAGDIPGVTLRSVVRPQQGGEAGALELVAQLQRQAFSGYLAVDNRGYRLTGPVQALLTYGANSHSALGERIEATIFQTEDWEQSFAQIAGEAFLGGSGLRLRGYAGAGRADPGGVLAAIGYQGHTTVAGLALQYPIIRSRPLNLFAGLQFDYLDSEVEVGKPGTRQSFDQVRTLRIGLEGNALDTLLPFAPGPAINSASIRLHRGLPWFSATGATDLPGPARVASDFDFVKWTGEASRTQPLWVPAEGLMFSLFGLVAGQVSDDILPLSEKFLFGGNRLGRGFYAGQVTGDNALGLTIELQLDVRTPPFQIPGLSAELVEVQPSAQFYLFRDFGRSWENLETDRDVTLESWGGGVRLFLTENVQLDVEAVRRLTRRVDAAGGSVPPLSETAGFFRLLTRF